MSAGKPHIFVSYSRSDAEFALKLGKDLRDAGVNIWIDQLDVPPGERWDRVVEQALESCESLLVILSPDSVSSDNVIDEVSFAIEEKKRIVPVLYRDCKVPLRLRRMQYIDFAKDYNHGFVALRSFLNSESTAKTGELPQLDEDIVEKPVRQLSGEEERPRWKLQAFVLVSLVLTGVLAGAIYLATNGFSDGDSAKTDSRESDRGFLESLAGTWEGDARSSLWALTKTTTKIEVTIRPDEYLIKSSSTSDDCMGRLEFFTQDEQSVTFQYQLTDQAKGQCIPNGDVTLSKGHSESLDYRFQGAAVLGGLVPEFTGTLYKTEK